MSNNVEHIKTPELDKMLAKKEESLSLSDFLDFLKEHYTICEFNDDGRCDFDSLGYAPTHDTEEQILAKYFEIDLKQVEIERQALLTAIRENM